MCCARPKTKSTCTNRFNVILAHKMIEYFSLRCLFFFSFSLLNDGTNVSIIWFYIIWVTRRKVKTNAHFYGSFDFVSNFFFFFFVINFQKVLLFLGKSSKCYAIQHFCFFSLFLTFVFHKRLVFKRLVNKCVTFQICIFIILKVMFLINKRLLSLKIYSIDNSDQFITDKKK